MNSEIQRFIESQNKLENKFQQFGIEVFNRLSNEKNEIEELKNILIQSKQEADIKLIHRQLRLQDATEKLENEFKATYPVREVVNFVSEPMT